MVPVAVALLAGCGSASDPGSTDGVDTKYQYCISHGGSFTQHDTAEDKSYTCSYPTSTPAPGFP
jgi:hypothetical protein